MIQSSEISETRRLHWSSLMFDIASHLWGYVIPIGIAVLGAARGDLFWTIMAGFFFLLSLLRSCIRYFTLTYTIADKKLIVKQGIFVRSNRTVPVRRIQNIDLVQNLFHRLLDVAEVKIETASGSEPEAVLRVLAMSQIEKLRNEIFENQQESEPRDQGNGLMSDGSRNLTVDSLSTPDTSELHPPLPPIGAAIPSRLQSPPPTPIIGIPAGWLLFAGVASNRGLILVGVLVGVVYQISEQTKLFQRVDFRVLSQWIPDDWDQAGFWLSVAIILAIAFIALKFLGVIWYLLRFAGYQLTRQGDDLRISCGLLTRVSATIPRPRIQFICIRQNPMSRWFGFCSVQVETAGGSKGTNARESVSGRWFLPVLPVSQLQHVLAEVKPGLTWKPETLSWQPLAEKAFWRMTRLGIVKAILVGIVVGFFFPPWGWLAGVLALPLIILWLRVKARNTGYARFEGGVTHRYGVINRITNLTFFETIQAIEVSQSPFDRRWQMATLAIDTAGAGPADSVIHIPMLSSSFTAAEQTKLVVLTSQHRLNILEKSDSQHQPQL